MQLAQQQFDVGTLQEANAVQEAAMEEAFGKIAQQESAIATLTADNVRLTSNAPPADAGRTSQQGTDATDKMQQQLDKVLFMVCSYQIATHAFSTLS